MTGTRPATGGVLATARRELRRWGSGPLMLFLLLVLPLASFAMLFVIFGAETPRALPVSVFDGDSSPLSRRLVRMVDATPGIRVAHRAASPEEGFEEILKGTVYAVLMVPAGLERDVRRGAAPAVVCYVNAQALLPASVVRKELRGAVATLSAGIELKVRAARGEAPGAALAHLNPIRLDPHGLFNPQLSYVVYLVTALLPTLLQMFILVAAVQAVGSELRDGTAHDWLETGGGSVVRAVAGKLLPYAVHFTGMALFLSALLFRGAHVPLRGSAALVVAGTVLFVLAYAALGLLLVSLFANLRLATSAAAFIAGPAFAFVGITFPVFGMPPVARVWSALLPLTHYLKLLVEQGVRGASPAVSLAPLGALLAFVVVCPLLSLLRLRRLMTDPGEWGRS